MEFEENGSFDTSGLSVATPDFRERQIAFFSQWLHKGAEERIMGIFKLCFEVPSLQTPYF